MQTQRSLLALRRCLITMGLVYRHLVHILSCVFV
jgi:hypothetical protein